MRNRVFLISTGMPGQKEAFEEPGINAIASYLRYRGYEVTIKLVLEEELDIKELEDSAPILIGFSVYTDTYARIRRMCQLIKQNINNTFIVLGGYVPSYYPREVLCDIPEADAVTIGEGEIPTAELADFLSGLGTIKDVHNLAYRNNDTVIFNEKAPLITDLDSMPYAARDIAKKYDPSEIWISTSRGCTRNCAFCCSQDFWRKKESHNWRGRSVDNIIGEIKNLVNDYGIRQFEFIDNSFEDPYPYMSRANDISEAILKENLKVAFGVNMRAETCAKMSDEDIQTLKQAGFSYVYLGIEGFSSNSLRVYQKTANVQHNKLALSFLEKHGIPVDIGFINFNPYSIFEDLAENVTNLKEFGLAYLQYILTFLFVFRGTRLYHRVKEDHLLYKDDGVEDFLCYHYLDPKVEKVADYLINKRKYIEKSGVMDEGFFIVHFRKKSAQLVNLMKKYDFFDPDMAEYNNEVYKLIERERKYINEVATEWFLQILELGKTEFDKDSADQFTDIMIEKLKVNSFDEIKRMKTILYGKAYKKFFKAGLRIK